MNPFQHMSRDEAGRFMLGKEEQRIRDVMAEAVGQNDVIDLGCGRGIGVKKYHIREQYLGVDCSPELVHLAIDANPGYQFEVGDIAEVKGHWSFGLLKSVLEHQPSLERAHDVYRAALNVVDTLLVGWHTPPIYSETTLINVQAEFAEPLPQNHYQSGSFDDGDLLIDKHRVDEFEVWSVVRRGLRTDIGSSGTGDRGD